MKSYVSKLVYVLALVLIIISCQQSDVNEEVLENSATLKSTVVDGWTMMDNGAWEYATGDKMYDICGEGDTYPFFESAMVTISNDEDCIYVKVVAEEGWKIGRLFFNAWPVGSPDINDNYGSFPYQKWFDSEEMSDVVIFKVCDQWLDSECLVFNIKLYTISEDGSKYWWVTTDNLLDYDRNNVFLDYCWEDCECYPYRTQTPGGWGAPGRGNNPGTYRDAHFDGAFPDGLIVGMEDEGFSMLLTSAHAVESFLPSGGKPVVLEMDYVDPGKKDLKNSFAGHVVALTLSVYFDEFDEEFSMTKKNLGDLTFKEGSGFYGLTVMDILDEANWVLGGGMSDYSLQELHTIVSMINEYYVDGEWTGDGGLFEDCWDYDSYE